MEWPHSLIKANRALLRVDDDAYDDDDDYDDESMHLSLRERKDRRIDWLGFRE